MPTAPIIRVLATGGTIAGKTVSPGSSSRYASGVLTAEELLAAVPGLERYARLDIRQVANIGSEDMTEAVWLELARATAEAAAEPSVAGTVVLHGTDTLEETAYLLHLVLPPGKPLVVTGAMRPADAPSADGPANILNAVRLAAHPAAAGKGVLVTLNDRIHAARDVAKTDTGNLDAFQSPGIGPLGTVFGGEPRFLRAPRKPRAAGDAFSVAGLSGLPGVAILYGHAGVDGTLIDAAAASGAAGIVYAGVGMGMVHRAALPALERAVERGVAVVVASRVGRGEVALSAEAERFGCVAAADLNPQKARVLLQVALTRTAEPEALRAIFQTY